MSLSESKEWREQKRTLMEAPLRSMQWAGWARQQSWPGMEELRNGLEVSARKGSQRNQGPSGSSLNPGHTVETRIWITRMNVNPSGPEAPISFCRPNATKNWCHCLDPEPTPSGPCGNLALIILFTSRRHQYSNFDSFHIKYYRSYLECLKGFKREV